MYIEVWFYWLLEGCESLGGFEVYECMDLGYCFFLFLQNGFIFEYF